ncbi:MAG: site-specific integrase [Planctomycetaceae bacterium]|jgi:integrase|nr:site-specific integrase [Planctomycetaceae bacterium]
MKIPALCRQKRKSGDLAFVRIDGAKFYCGNWGTLEADENYQRILAEWLIAKRIPNSQKKRETVTIRVLVAAFLDHAETYYRKHGRQTGSYDRFVMVSKTLLKSYGSIPADDFDILSLETLRKQLIHSRKTPHSETQRPDTEKKPLSRKYVNQYIGNIRHIFKWGVSRKLVHSSTYYELMSLEALKEWRSDALELPDVRSVDDEVVEKTLPFLPSPVAAMVRLQRLTGMRPGEVRLMRACDINTKTDEWEYIPGEHKTEHHENCPRLIVLGPKAQTILMPYLIDNAETPEKRLFSPRESVAEMRARRRAARKTKVQPSQINRKKENPRCVVKEFYDKRAYLRAIERASEKAGVPHWFPNQLRHTALTAIRAKEGAEAAQVVASHKNLKTTEIYAEKDIAKAHEIAKKWG